MDYETFQASIKDYKNKSLIHNDVSANEAVKDWHAKYFDTAVSAYSKMLIADEMKHSEDVEKFGADFASLVGLIDDATDDKEAIAKELKSIDTIARSKADAALKRLSHGTDTKEGYTAAINAYKAEHLEHGEWKKHKYIRIENGRYIYPEDVKKETRQKLGAKLAEQNSKYLATDNTKFRELHNAVSGKRDKITDDNSWEKDKAIDKKLESAMEEKIVKAGKEVVDEVASDLIRTAEYWMKGFMEDDANLFDGVVDSIDHHFRAKGIDPNNSSISDYIEEDELINLLEKRVIKGLTDIVNSSDASKYDAKRLEEIKKELNNPDLMADFRESFKTNRPFANKESEDEVIRKNTKRTFKHSNENSQQSYFAAIDAYKQQKAALEHQSFNSRDAYRAAVAEYEGSHLEHHGVLGQKWGVRRYQNPDGSLTAAGKKRYSESDLDEIKKASEKGGKFFGVAGGIINGLRKKREIDKRNAKAEVDDKETIKDLAEVAAQNKPSGLADGKASSLFNKKEFDDIGKDPELDDLMFLELHTYNRSNLIGKEYGKEYNAEFERFKKDPKNYEIPKSMLNKQSDNDYTEAEKDAIRAKTGTKFSSSGDGFKSPYSKETQASKLENAKKNGTYDLTFLEIVQNDYYANHFTAKDKKRMLSEYEKYLKNGGQKYWDEIHKDESRW